MCEHEEPHQEALCEACHQSIEENAQWSACSRSAAFTLQGKLCG